MTTYNDFVEQMEQEKEKVICDCKNSATFRPKNLYVLPGGGFSAALYSLGIMKSLSDSGVLMTEDNEFNTDNMFIGSSGGSLVLFLTLTCLHLKLNKKEPENWFKLYVEDSFLRLQPFTVVELYVASQFRSLISEKIPNCFLDDLTYQWVDRIVNAITVDEMRDQKGIDFLNDELADYFRLNYIKVINGNMPYMTDNNKDLSDMTCIEQFKNMFSSSCTINGLSYARFFQNHDAGLLLNNYVNCLPLYIENPHIRNIMCYTLNALDKHSYDIVMNKNAISNYTGRTFLEANYFFIQMLQKKCKSTGKNFCLIIPPNKFNPIRKHDVALYNQLQQRIYYETDFAFFTERFLGNYFLHNGPDMRRIVILFGYYETLYILREINAFHRKKRKQFANVNIDFLNTLEFNNGVVGINEGRANLFRLTPSDIQKASAFMKYNGAMMESVYKQWCGCKEKGAEFLTEYLKMMQLYKPGAEKYNALFPVAKMKKKIVRKPEKSLDKEFKRVSKNIVNIYFPSFAEKLKYIIPFT